MYAILYSVQFLLQSEQHSFCHLVDIVFNSCIFRRHNGAIKTVTGCIRRREIAKILFCLLERFSFYGAKCPWRQRVIKENLTRENGGKQNYLTSLHQWRIIIACATDALLESRSVCETQDKCRTYALWAELFRWLLWASTNWNAWTLEFFSNNVWVISKKTLLQKKPMGESIM